MSVHTCQIAAVRELTQAQRLLCCSALPTTATHPSKPPPCLQPTLVRNAQHRLQQHHIQFILLPQPFSQDGHWSFESMQRQKSFVQFLE